MSKIVFIFFTILCTLSSCKKLVEIPEPINTITTSEAFSTVENATAAIRAIYSQMSYVNGNAPTFSNAATSIYSGLSADELNANGGSPYELNNILPTDGNVRSFFWTRPYFNVYQQNVALEGLTASSTLPEVTKEQLTGEAKFLRALTYFYLVNLFGDVPLLTTTSYASNSLASRTTVAKVYEQIIADLTDAENSLPADYSGYNNARTRATKYAAAALLARVYLYQGKWAEAAIEASTVINCTGLYMLADLTQAFSIGSSEAILQFEVPNSSPYATIEGRSFIPSNGSVVPGYYLTNSLIGAFEPNDLRWLNWVKKNTNSGISYYYPYKYKVRVGSPGNVTEYYMVLRLAEQYLIRAEAEANGADGGVVAAVADLNVVRQRAGLADYSGNLSSASVLDAIYHERQIELFAEWGHRWFDLKRWGTATQVLGINKGITVSSDMLLYPIPFLEIQADPNLVQNPGY